MNEITIAFASRDDLETARRQIEKARDYYRRGGQLGTLGQALLLKTLERATDISTTTNRAARAAQPEKETCK